MEVKHVSASSFNKFNDCRAGWLASYDEDLKYSTSNRFSERGKLVHAALEFWFAPENAHIPRTIETLLDAYRKVCAQSALGESLDTYKTGFDILRRIYGMFIVDPQISLDRMISLGVEVQINDFKMPGWEYPLKGYIDNISMLRNPIDADAITLLVVDYKTGQPKTREELLGDDCQPSLYVTYVVHVIVPFLQSQVNPETGNRWRVAKVFACWLYIGENEKVELIDSNDFALDISIDYIGNLSRQMKALVTEWNEFIADVPPETPNAEKIGMRIQFLSRRETLGSHCRWCIRKGECQTMNRAMELGGPHQPVLIQDFDYFFEQRERYAAVAKTAEERRQEFDTLFRDYLNYEKLDSVMANGKVWTAKAMENREHDVKAVVDALGVETVLSMIKIPQNVVDAELARIAAHDKEKAKEIKAELDRKMIRRTGARVVRKANT